MTTNLIATLSSRRQWVVYAADKKPMQINGWGASSTDPLTWASYEEGNSICCI